jgi:ketosteroid isomerase-like protein
MTTDNQKLVQTVYAAFQQRDLSALSRLIAPEIEISQSPELPWGGRYQGLGGLTQFFASLVQHIDSNVELDQLIDAGEHVVAVGRTSGTVLKNKAPFDVPVVHVWGIRDGLVVSFQPYIDVPLMKKSLA